MKRSNTVIIGAGQTGLAMSRELSKRSINHVILERGKIANSWRKERWDSLRLLTPNWMNGLPGAPYLGRDPEGYMPVNEFADDLTGFAAANRAPVKEETSVLGVSPFGVGYRVQTDQGAIDCENVVVATGAASRTSRPSFAQDLSANITQLSPLDYKRPNDLPPGRVLVVGASASGTQIAREIHNSGRDVTIAVGEHFRVPRSYRDADILSWMEITGRWGDRYDEVEDLDRQRGVPSLQLTGQAGTNPLDLNALQDIGVEIVGRMAGVRDNTVMFSGSLANVCAAADLKMNRLLKGFDDWAHENGLFDKVDACDRPARTRVPHAPRLSIDLGREGFGTVIWATGYRPDHSWIDLPVFDRKGRIRHDGGIVSPGLYVMGLPFLRQRKSTFIDGAANDARDLANHLTRNLGLIKAA
ncbi:NAD(P)-binding domain-containing protein [Aliiroseovarius sp. KMU-50]|uniref:NAD(P)-binding domain-containing protein n=1 Tax=Aliiroseovarius salicola TaxID=3009082 RepID=A0ABT4VZ30_9RHOB|nr:NAD(P)-binding domain-containing protein [Aliiroseovarius sp. KMU-50]MDA5092793.1 NAD(P)-binding domain-containing protein [Aliiroseovarius sp. KMU-50]